MTRVTYGVSFGSGLEKNGIGITSHDFVLTTHDVKCVK